MAAPLFSVVRADALVEDHSEVDAESGATIYSQPLEVKLVDDLGYPCAIPSSQPETDEDITYRHGDGDRSKASVIHRHEIILPCDYLTAPTRSRLQNMKRERALVRYTPGYGRHTICAWRPAHEANATTYTDLTGNVGLTGYYEPDYTNYWNDLPGDLNAMCKPSAGYHRYAATPGGTGAIFEDGLTNLADPATPTGAGAVASGWSLAGSGISDSFVTNGFGADDCPHSLRIVASHQTGTRYASFSFPSATGSASPGEPGTINIGFWIKGRLTTEANVSFYNNAGEVSSSNVVLDENYPDWTRIDVQAITTLIATDTKQLIVKLEPYDEDQSADFEVGPICEYWLASNYEYSPAFCQWQPEGATKDPEYMITTDDLQLPPVGTVFISCYLPEWYEDRESSFMGLMGTGDATTRAGTFYCWSSSANSDIRLIFNLSSTQGITSAVDDLTLVPGAMNTFAATWSNDGAAIYHNGVSMNDLATASYYEKDFPDDQLVIGGGGAFWGNIGSWPLMPTSFRLEREVWTAERVAQEHSVHGDDAALGSVIAARGRLYEIVKIPSTPRIAEGGAHFIGNLVLRQMQYEHSLADLLTKEY